MQGEPDSAYRLRSVWVAVAEAAISEAAHLILLLRVQGQQVSLTGVEGVEDWL